MTALAPSPSAASATPSTGSGRSPREPETHSFILQLASAAPVAELEQWLDSARPGEKAIYASGVNLSLVEGAPGVRLAYRWAKAGTVGLQRERDKTDPRRWIFLIVKSHPRPAPALLPTPSAGRRAALPGELQALFELIERAASRRQPCPSFTVMARSLRHGTRFRARGLFERLEAEGLIAVERRGCNLPMVVTIVKSGKETKR